MGNSVILSEMDEMWIKLEDVIVVQFCAIKRFPSQLVCFFVYFNLLMNRFHISAIWESIKYNIVTLWEMDKMWMKVEEAILVYFGAIKCFSSKVVGFLTSLFPDVHLNISWLCTSRILFSMVALFWRLLRSLGCC